MFPMWSSGTLAQRLLQPSQAPKRRIRSGKRADASGVGKPEAVKNDTLPQVDTSYLDCFVGKANECNAFIDGHPCRALLDTGSQVTSISESFYKGHLSHHMIQSVDKLLKVVGITGQAVQFLGYIEVDLKFPESESGTNTSQKAFVLVVPDTKYNKRVPLVPTVC